MIYKVRHLTRLTYSAPIAHARYNLRLEPASWSGQTMSKYKLSLSPEAGRREARGGPYWVVTTRIAFARPLRSLKLLSEFIMEIEPQEPPKHAPSLIEVCNEALAARDLSPLAPAPYLFASRIAEASDEISGWAKPCIFADASIVEVATKLMSAIHREFAYKPGVTDSTSAPIEAFRAKEGVCQDFAHVMIIALRAHGIPAAYASGYLRTVPPPGEEKLIGADAMHAWVNVWCGNEIGWVGFDPTNDCLVSGDHIQIAMGRDYADVSPIDGTFVGSAPQEMDTSVDVELLSSD